MLPWLRVVVPIITALMPWMCWGKIFCQSDFYDWFHSGQISILQTWTTFLGRINWRSMHGITTETSDEKDTGDRGFISSSVLLWCQCLLLDGNSISLYSEWLWLLFWHCLWKAFWLRVPSTSYHICVDRMGISVI